MVRQRGNVFVIILCLLAAVAGAWQFSEYRDRERKSRAALEEEAKADFERREREELERRVAAAEAEKDALRAALKNVDDLTAQWSDAVRVAGATSRIALSGPVSNMQALRRQAKELTVPPCLDRGKEDLLRSMDFSLEAYMTFMVHKDKIGDLLTGSLFDEAAAAMKAFNEARASCPA